MDSSWHQVLWHQLGHLQLQWCQGLLFCSWRKVGLYRHRGRISCSCNSSQWVYSTYTHSSSLPGYIWVSFQSTYGRCFVSSKDRNNTQQVLLLKRATEHAANNFCWKHVWITPYFPKPTVGHKANVYIDVRNPTGTQCSGFSDCSGLLKEEDGTDIPSTTYMISSRLVCIKRWLRECMQ